jgi:predicted PurR-regulated permease PerM
MVTTPPALLLLAVTAFGPLFGIVGVIIAAPLTVALYVAIQKLYIEHTRGQTSSVPGES